MTRTSDAGQRDPRCCFCSAPLSLTVVDLGMSPLCESFLRLSGSRRWSRSTRCTFARASNAGSSSSPAFVPPDEIFTEYAYFSAYSTAWVEHARQYVGDDPRTARGSAQRISSSSSPRTTATSSSTSSAPGSRSSASIRRPTSRKPPRSEAFRRSSRSSVGRSRTSWRRRESARL